MKEFSGACAQLNIYEHRTRNHEIRVFLGQCGPVWY